MKPVTRLFDTRTQAEAAVAQLEAAGIDHARLSLIARRDGANDLDHHDHHEAGEGAAKGATTGGLIGGGAGLLAGLGMLAIPGVGPVVAAGWLAATLTGAVAGAAAGAATGGVLGALKDAGHTDEEANVYAEGVRRGGVLVSVKPDNDAEAAQAERILSANAGTDAAVRGNVYRQSGWQGFDEAAAPYPLDEGRSFASSDDVRSTLADDDMRSDTPRSIDPSVRSY